MKKFISVLIPMFLLISFAVSGQNILPSVGQENQSKQDTALVPFLPIQITEIASATTATLNQINQAGQQRLSEEEIYRMVNQSDALNLEIDLFLNDSSLWDFEGSSTRELEYLENRSDIYLNHRSLFGRNRLWLTKYFQ